VEISTARLLLREFQPEDWVAVHAYQRDPRYFQYYEWTERTEDDVRAVVQGFCDQQHVEPRRKFQLAVTLRDDGTLIGNAGIRRKELAVLGSVYPSMVRGDFPSPRSTSRHSFKSRASFSATRK
jgi:RimJ/RimL family protein N-acetyltransferase